jgi:hypothetical protein
MGAFGVHRRGSTPAPRTAADERPRGLDSGTSTGDDNLSDDQRVKALHHALTGLLDTRMTAAGWHADPTANLGTL